MQHQLQYNRFYMNMNDLISMIDNFVDYVIYFIDK